MMEIKGNMMSVREDVRVLDATLRDGGLVIFILRMTLCTIYIKQIWRPVWIIWSLDTVRTKSSLM